MPGIAIILLITKINQGTQELSAIELMEQFFEKYSTWYWAIPVIAGKFEENENCWNPLTSLSDKFHPMSIVTPVQHQNTTLNVSLGSRRVIQETLNRGKLKLASTNGDWNLFFEEFQVENEFDELLILTAKVHPYLGTSGLMERFCPESNQRPGKSIGTGSSN